MYIYSRTLEWNIESKLAYFGSRAGVWVGSVGGDAWDGSCTGKPFFTLVRSLCAPICTKFQFGLKPSDNLMLSGKFFGVHLDEESPQIVGGGIHYISGENQDWVISFQKSALNGINDFRIASTLFHLDKRLRRSFYDFFIGFGINYFIFGPFYYLSNCIEIGYDV